MKTALILLSVALLILAGNAHYWTVDKNIAENYGQIGDFFGGILNPILTFCTIYLLVKSVAAQQEANQKMQDSIKIQKEELQLTRSEMKQARKEMTKRNNEARGEYNIKRHDEIFFQMYQAWRDIRKDEVRLNEQRHPLSLQANQIERSAMFLEGFCDFIGNKNLMDPHHHYNQMIKSSMSDAELQLLYEYVLLNNRYQFRELAEKYGIFDRLSDEVKKSA